MRRASVLLALTFVLLPLLAGCAFFSGAQEEPVRNVVAIAEVDRNVARVGEPLRFDASRSIQRNVTVTDYVWSFGDGGTAGNKVAHHAYAAPGDYVVSLALTTREGLTADTRGKDVFVTILPAKDATGAAVRAFAAPTRAHPGSGVAFSGYAMGAPPGDGVANWTWDFGDGRGGEGPRIAHAYESPGNYPARLTVETRNGLTASYGVTIRVVPPDALPPQSARAKTHYVEILSGAPATLDPARLSDLSGVAIVRNLYETLYDYEGTSSTVKPRLAAALPRSSGDGRVQTIPLNPDARFHDDSPVTAQDVAFSLNRLRALDSELPQGIPPPFPAFERAEPVDALTVRLHLSRPDPQLITELARPSTSILNRALVENAPPGFLDASDAGSGPYMLDAHVPGHAAHLSLAPGRNASILTASIYFVIDGATREIAARSHLVDAIDATSALFESARIDTGLRRLETPSSSVELLVLNQGLCEERRLAAEAYAECQSLLGRFGPRDGIGGRVDRVFFSDPHARRALVAAFDARGYVDDGVRGHATPLGAPLLLQGLPGATEALPATMRDTARAREEISRSRHADGFTLPLVYLQGDTARAALVRNLAQGLEAALPGKVKVETVELSLAEYVRARQLDALPAFVFPILLEAPLPGEFLGALALPDGLVSRLAGYHNASAAAAVQRASAESDPNARAREYAEVVAALDADTPYLFTMQPHILRIERTWLKGYEPNPWVSPGPGAGRLSALSKA